MVRFTNTTTAAYRYLSSRNYFDNGIVPGTLSPFDGFYEYLQTIETCNFDAWSVMSLPQNSYSEIQTERLWLDYMAHCQTPLQSRLSSNS
ncbi:MAG: hypothetical protein QF718_09220 [Phycisphaerales bacterium]|nr:hypothetical protein [Phycisphaerales bacterium]